MASNRESELQPAWAWLAMAFSAALAFFGTGLHPVWTLTWLAPLPVLLIAPRVSTRNAFCFSALAWLLGGLNLWHYLHRTVHVPTPVCVLALVAPALVFGCAAVFFRALIRSGRITAAALAVPVIWVAYEYAFDVLSPHATFQNLAYSQMNFLPVIQIASLTGIWGISFLLFLFPASIAAIANGHVNRKQSQLVAGGTALIFALVFVFGIYRLRTTPQGATVTAAMIASDLPGNVFPPTPEQAQRTFEDYAAQTQRLAGAQVIVLPEKIAPTSASAIGFVDATFAGVTRQTDALIVVGVLRQPTPGARSFNEARVYAAGALQATYDKHHLIPGLEGDEQSGKTLTMISQPSGRWGIQICKDMDFPWLSRRYAQAGVGLVLAPAWDFVSDGWLHDRMAVLRGVESGFTLVRSAKTGLLTASDDRGRILAQRSSSAAPFSVLTVRVPVRHDATLYARWGDWFAWLNLFLLAALLILPGRAARKPLHAEQRRLFMGGRVHRSIP